MKLQATTFFVIVLAALAGTSAAQTPDSLLIGDCHDPPDGEEPGADEHLELDGVRARILNRGNLFWGGGPNVYEAPRGSGNHSEFIVNLIIGGLIDDDFRVAGSSYGPFEFWPGPLDDSGRPPSDCLEYDRFWKVDRNADLSPEANKDGPSDAVLSWPVELGAPFVDTNGNGDYEPSLGDRPRMLGDQMVWWVMNDRGGEHQRYDSLPLGVEVRGTTYGYNRAGALAQTTFYRYEITNRNTRPIDSLFVAWNRDVSLGFWRDDYVGSDTTLNLAYSYNADNFDDNPPRWAYGAAPPAAGFLIVPSDKCVENDSRVKTDGLVRCWTKPLSVHLRYCDWCGPPSEPDSPEQWQNFMNGRWRDGSPLSNTPYFGTELMPEGEKFMYPGDPVTGSWLSELNTDGEGTQNEPNGRRHVAGSRDEPLMPGETVVVTFALVWSRGTSNLDSVSELRRTARVVLEGADIHVTPQGLPAPEAPPLRQPDIPFAASVYPNPASVDATLRLGLPQPMDARVDIFDTLGRRVAAIVDAWLDAGDRTWTLDTADWPPGVYLVRIQLDHITETRRLVVVK